MTQVLNDASGIRLLANLDLDSVGSVERQLTELFQTDPRDTFTIDLSGLTGMDTATADETSVRWACAVTAWRPYQWTPPLQYLTQ